MSDINDNIKVIEKALSKFEKGADELQNKAFDRLIGNLGNLQYTADGSLKPSKANILELAKIKSGLSNFLAKNSKHADEFADEYSNLEKIAKNYYKDIAEKYSEPVGMEVIKKASVDSLYSGLLDEGVNGVITSEVSNIFYSGIQAGMTRNDLITQLRNYMLGDGKTLGHLVRYSKQIADDSINQYDASVDMAITDHLGFEWFQYTGGIIDSTRPFCTALTRQRYIHESEFAKAADGVLRNGTVSKAGMIKGTNASNLRYYRGGYQCRHKFRGVIDSKVPKEVRDAVLGRYDNK